MGRPYKQSVATTPCVVCSEPIPQDHPADLCGKCIAGYRAKLTHAVDRNIPVGSHLRAICLLIIRTWTKLTATGLDELRLTVCDKGNFGIPPEEWQEHGHVKQEVVFVPEDGLALCPYCSETYTPKRKNQATCGAEDCITAHRKASMARAYRKQNPDALVYGKERNRFHVSRVKLRTSDGKLYEATGDIALVMVINDGTLKEIA